MDDVRALDELRQHLGHGRIEPPDRLRPAEDEEHPVAGRDPELGAGGLPVEAAQVADRGPGDVARVARAHGCARRREAHREHVGEAGGRPDAAARDDVALPHDDRDPQRRGGHEDRDRGVAAGREDRRRALADEDRRCLGDRRAEADGVQDEVDVPLGRPKRTQDEPLERDPGGTDEPALEAPVAAEPVDVSLVPRAQRLGDGQGRVDVPARASARDQQTHRSRSPSPRSPEIRTGGYRRR